ncbi:MAG: hypothetical protein IKH19_09610 [Muribaculaceae bacterium]|nr:hypothetical protein [Muribaculaceae bacterium]
MKKNKSVILYAILFLLFDIPFSFGRTNGEMVQLGFDYFINHIYPEEEIIHDSNIVFRGCTVGKLSSIYYLVKSMDSDIHIGTHNDSTEKFDSVLLNEFCKQHNYVTTKNNRILIQKFAYLSYLEKPDNHIRLLDDSLARVQLSPSPIIVNDKRITVAPPKNCQDNCFLMKVFDSVEMDNFNYISIELSNPYNHEVILYSLLFDNEHGTEWYKYSYYWN